MKPPTPPSRPNQRRAPPRRRPSGAAPLPRTSEAEPGSPSRNTSLNSATGEALPLSAEAVFSALWEQLPFPLYIVDSNYRIQSLNRQRAHLEGETPQTFLNKVCYRALFRRNSPCAECCVTEVLRSGSSAHRQERRRSQAGVIEWEIYAFPIGEAGGRATHVALLEVDITEKRHLEALLIQAEKLAAIGQLAAGIAHEINNPLTAIIANAQMLQRDLPPHSDWQESVDLIARAGARAAQIVRNLLDFARKDERRLSLTDVHETLQRALELVHHEVASRGVHLEFAPDPTLPPILANQDGLQSVWLNLLLNALDALDKTPATITVRTSQVPGAVVVSVSDNGKGIPSDDLNRIFEPFFTTKTAGQGTGLGLSVCHRIVAQHGGRIGVESQLGLGSTFTVTLPSAGV